MGLGSCFKFWIIFSCIPTGLCFICSWNPTELCFIYNWNPTDYFNFKCIVIVIFIINTIIIQLVPTVNVIINTIIIIIYPFAINSTNLCSFLLLYILYNYNLNSIYYNYHYYNQYLCYYFTFLIIILTDSIIFISIIKFTTLHHQFIYLY